MKPNVQKIETLVRELLLELGEDPAREGLQKTPLRVAQALSFLTQGYRADVRQVINNALFTACASTTCCRSSAAATSATSPTARCSA
jgi:GTP cyclohydrolase I